MLDLLKTIRELLRDLGPNEMAKLSAYLLAPGSVLLLTILGLSGGSFAIDVTRPVAVSQLRTEISSTGITTRKPGVVIIVEPNASEFRIPLQSSPSRVWSSLDESAARANKDHLVLDGGGFRSKPPYLGVGEPVTMVVEAQAGNEIQILGGTEKMDDLLLRSRRSVTVMTGVLVACIFAFGMSSAASLPAVRRKKHAGR